MPIVNSWNEWDVLREVFLGTMEGKQLTSASEPAVRRKYENADIFNLEVTDPVADLEAEAHRCVERFASMLQEEGIKVTRPQPIDFSKSIQTPLFDVDRSNGATCPRDVFVVFGNNVVEAPMSWRSRYFEHYAWREAMMQYWKRDQGMRWTCCPKPIMADSSYQAAPLKTLNNDEMMFDAADCRRFGKDVFMQSQHTANDAGMEWMRRTLAADGIRLHEFEFEQSVFSHIDAKITPVNEFQMVWTQAERPSESMFQLFKQNEWQMIEAPARYACCSKRDQTGLGIHLNMLAAGPGRVFVEESEAGLIKTLREEGVDCIPIRYAPCYAFGGGLNCWTLDISRDGYRKSYFATLDEQEERSARPIPTPVRQRA